MAQTYLWSDLISHVAKFIKGTPTSTIDAQTCDYISSEMWTHYPFKEAIQNITNGSIPLVDGQQDYSAPTNLYRLLKARITRTDQSPNLDYELSVAAELVPDLIPRSITTIRSICWDAATGKLRLESAVQVPSGTTSEIRGDYQINPTKVTSTSQGAWFSDQYAPVAEAGILYYYYLLSDNYDAAGSATTRDDGTAVYTGQLAVYKAKLKAMVSSEDFPGIQSLFPGESMGAGRDTNRGLVIYP